MKTEDINNLWYSFKKVPGAKFQLNDTAKINAGEYKGEYGSVISLLNLYTIPKYLIELHSGKGDIEILESEIEDIPKDDLYINNDLEIIKPFMDKKYIERFDNLIESKKGREKIIKEFAHKFVEKFKKIYMNNVKGNANDIFNVLKSKDADESCYVISEKYEIDGKTLLLKDVLAEVVGYDMGTFILCKSNKLAYYEGEDSNEQWILEIK